jgi:thiol-disulfide isomerase/thioredoxin
MRIKGLFPGVVTFLAIALVWGISGPASATEVALRFKDPDGSVVRGATAAIVPAGHTALVSDGPALDDDPGYVVGKTDDDGRVRLRTDAGDFLVILVHDRGYAVVGRDAATRPGGDVTLTRWGRIEGEVRVGAKAAAGEPVRVWTSSERPASGGEEAPGWMFSTKLKADADGKFVVERVPAGQAHVVSNRDWWGRGPFPRPLVKREVRLAETTRVMLGGRGRPVVGRVEIPDSLRAEPGFQFVYGVVGLKVPETPSPVPADVKAKSLAEQADWWRAFRGTEAHRAYLAERQKGTARAIEHLHPFEIGRDGSFRVEDVMPGTYTLRIDAAVPFKEGRPGKNLGVLRVPIEVAAFEGERTDVPQDLGVLKWEGQVFHAPKAGDVAPDFDVHGLDEGRIKLSDYRGKFVVIDFWATWCGPCLEEIPHVIDAQRTLAQRRKDVVFVSLSLDNEPDPLIEFVKKNGMTWRQGFLGAWDADPVTKSYGVNGIPSMWLVGPDGKVVSEGFRGEDLMEQITRAMEGHRAGK